jgi:hypothetical protein
MAKASRRDKSDPEQTDCAESIEAARLTELTIKLSQIAGLHPAVLAAYESLSVPVFRFPVLQAKSDPALVAVLANLPIRVTRERHRLRCVGNIRAYQALLAVSPPDQLISCIEVSNTTVDQIRMDCINELIYLPVIAGVHFSEIKILHAVAGRAALAGIWNSPEPLDQYFAKVYGVDRRQFANKVRTDTSAPVAPDPDTNQPANHDSTDGADSLPEPPTPTTPLSAKPSPLAEKPSSKSVTYEIRKAGTLLGHFQPVDAHGLDQLASAQHDIEIRQCEPNPAATPESPSVPLPDREESLAVPKPAQPVANPLELGSDT